MRYFSLRLRQIYRGFDMDYVPCPDSDEYLSIEAENEEEARRKAKNYCTRYDLEIVGVHEVKEEQYYKPVN